MLRRVAELINNSPVTVLLRAIEPYLVIFAVVTFLHEVGNWKIQRDSMLWQQVSMQGPGDLGRKMALEQLNSLGVSLTGINLSEARHGGSVVLNKVDLKEAKLENIDFSGSKLRGANFRKATGYNIVFNNRAASSTDLRETDFTKGNFSDSIFCHVLATEARFDNAALPDVFFVGANLIDASFKGSILDGTHFHGGNLKGVDFSNAMLKGAYFSNVDLDCEEFKKGRQWQEAYRDGPLTCGAHRVTPQVVPVYYSKEPSEQSCEISKYQKHIEQPKFE